MRHTSSVFCRRAAAVNRRPPGADYVVGDRGDPAVPVSVVRPVEEGLVSLGAQRRREIQE